MKAILNRVSYLEERFTLWERIKKEKKHFTHIVMESQLRFREYPFHCLMCFPVTIETLLKWSSIAKHIIGSLDNYWTVLRYNIIPGYYCLDWAAIYFSLQRL